MCQFIRRPPPKGEGSTQCAGAEEREAAIFEQAERGTVFKHRSKGIG
jgi:hypothetical protein